MITGFNTEIKFRGQVFHVQTEDKGASNPVIESLVYKGGEILATRRHSYRHLVGNGCEEKDVTKLMEEQHRKVITDIQNGKMEGTRDPFLDDDDDRELDDLAIAYLESPEYMERLRIALPDKVEVVPGVPSEFVITTRKGVSLDPISGARVSVNLFSGGRMLPLFTGASDRFGKITAKFTVPSSAAVGAVLQITATSEHGQDECEHAVQPAGPGT